VAEQVPTWFTRLQVRQTPSHFELQQTPSAQFPDAHSVATVQAAPIIFLPQLPWSHF
jgi:hypothetical protein